MSPRDRILYVVTTERGDRVGIISARVATSHERRLYEQAPDPGEPSAESLAEMPEIDPSKHRRVPGRGRHVDLGGGQLVAGDADLSSDLVFGRAAILLDLHERQSAFGAASRMNAIC
jgi:hypothetical protein